MGVSLEESSNPTKQPVNDQDLQFYTEHEGGGDLLQSPKCKNYNKTVKQTQEENASHPDPGPGFLGTWNPGDPNPTAKIGTMKKYSVLSSMFSPKSVLNHPIFLLSTEISSIALKSAPCSAPN